jgi:hypothetical protein
MNAPLARRGEGRHRPPNVLISAVVASGVSAELRAQRPAGARSPATALRSPGPRLPRWKHEASATMPERLAVHRPDPPS